MTKAFKFPGLLPLGGALAVIRGWEVDSPQAIGGIMLIVLGDLATGVGKEAGKAWGKSAGKELLKGVSGKSLAEINKRVGFSLITKAGQKSVVSLSSMVPVLGGFIGAAVDGGGCYAASYTIDRGLLKQ